MIFRTESSFNFDYLTEIWNCELGSELVAKVGFERRREGLIGFLDLRFDSTFFLIYVHGFGFVFKKGMRERGNCLHQ